MIAFLKSIDNKSWKAVVFGLEHPIGIDVAGKVSLKPELTWSSAEDEAALGNSRVLNARFNGVDQNVFRLINTCTFTKEAWNILQVAYEGTSKEKMLRLQILTSHFEALKMSDDETIVDFNVRVLDIANESFALGEKMSKTKLVRKVLRSLPQRFNMKVTAIKEANDVTTKKLDVLFGSLRTFELNMGEGNSKNKSGITFLSVSEYVPQSPKEHINEETLSKFSF